MLDLNVSELQFVILPLSISPFYGWYMIYLRKTNVMTILTELSQLTFQFPIALKFEIHGVDLEYDNWVDTHSACCDHIYTSPHYV